MNENLNEAASTKLKNKMKNEICQACKILLDKYFEGREYDKDKVNLWKNYTMDELSNFLKSNYKNYGFCLFMNIIKKGDIRIYSNGLCREETDSILFHSIETKSLFVEIRILFYKLYNSDINLSDLMNDELLIKMNNLLSNKLKGNSYSYEFAKKATNDIVVEFENYLLKFKIKTCTFQICNIISYPFEYQFAYKIINLDYFPLIASYQNENLLGQLILFLLNN